MDFNSIKEKGVKWLKSNNTNYLIVLILAVIFVYIVYSFFFDSKANYTFMADNKSIKAASSDESTSTKKEYEEQQKTELKNILKQIQGVGNVDVMITFESDETKVPAVDTTNQKTTTEETDKEGGKRVNNSETGDSKVVMSSSGKGNEPLIVKTYKPKVVGVIIVAEGAESSKTKFDIMKAVSNIYNLSADKVNVYPMKK